MGFFKTEDCPICGKLIGAFSKSSVRYNDKFICSDCVRKLLAEGTLLTKLKQQEDVSLEELQRIVNTPEQLQEQHKLDMSSFNPTKQISIFIYFDDKNKKFAIPKVSFSGTVQDMQIYNYSDILDYELIEDGNSISKGGIGRALVGGMLFGGVGAIVGGSTGHKQRATCSKLQIKITLNNMTTPVVYVNFIETETKKDSRLYKMSFAQAQETMSLLNIICQSIKTQETPNSVQITTPSLADELIKFKQLLDTGAITQEEFEAIKKQLLNL